MNVNVDTGNCGGGVAATSDNDISKEHVKKLFWGDFQFSHNKFKILFLLYFLA